VSRDPDPAMPRTDAVDAGPTALTARGLATVTRLREAKVFHPAGVAFDAVWTPVRPGILAPGAALAAVERPAIARLSRVMGPSGPPVPDLLGLAVRVLGVHGPGQDQDLLFASVGRGLLTGRVPVPRGRLDGTRFSTLLPYELRPDVRSVLLAEVHADQVVRLRDVPQARSLPVEVRIVAASGGDLGVVRLGPRREEETSARLCFDPWRTGTELRPVGVLNQLRHATA
jgi:hypothetical protein